MPDFWKSSGYTLLRRDADGWLRVTDDFLRAYYLRPEMHPVEESCAAERALHGELMAAPRMAVGDDRLDAFADADARDNYKLVLALRDRLLSAETVEAAYLSIFGEPASMVPPLFVDQLAHVILRGVLDGVTDPLRVRAAECLFRAQTMNVVDGAVMAADAETVDLHAATGGFGDLGQLVVAAQTEMRSIDLDVLTADNAEAYWSRDEAHDTVLDLTFTRPGLDALCRVLESWVAHFHGVAVRIQPVQEIRDQRWVWHIGLDVEASAILNDLYDGTEVEGGRLERLLSLFRLEFDDPAQMRQDIAGRPIYLGMAMTPAKELRLKPQNLLVNLPLKVAS